MTAKGDFFPRRINSHVPDMQYAADVRFGGVGTIVIPAPATADDDLFGATLDADAVAGTELLTGSFTVDAKFGRNVVFTASAATGASAVYRVRGADYLGQPMYEDISVANADGTTPKPGKKAFKYITSVKATVAAASAVTLKFGTGTVLGLPYKSQKLISELVSKEVPANAGTLVDGLTTGTAQTGTTDDTRGTYAPHSSVVPNGTREYELTFMHDTDNLHGDAQAFV